MFGMHFMIDLDWLLRALVLFLAAVLRCCGHPRDSTYIRYKKEAPIVFNRLIHDGRTVLQLARPGGLQSSKNIWTSQAPLFSNPTRASADPAQPNLHNSINSMLIESINLDQK
jgi:hypothetical protein